MTMAHDPGTLPPAPPPSWDLVVAQISVRIDDLRDQQNARLDRIEARVARTNEKVDQVRARVSRWAGALTIIGGALGALLTFAVATVKAHWPS